MELGWCMILIYREFVIFSSFGFNFSFILHNASPGRKANGMAVLGWCIILIGNKSEVSSSFASFFATPRLSSRQSA
jgi:hypothetical protein